MRKRLFREIKNHFDSIRNGLKDYSKKADAETIHTIRLEIKKIKALLSFIKKTRKEKHVIHSVDSVFDELGKIRTTQIHIRTLNRFNIKNKALIRQLNREEKYRQLKFKKHISSHLASIRSIPEDTFLDSGSIGKKHSEKYFKKTFDKLEELLSEHTKKDLHRFRTRIKRMMYVYKALPKKMQEENHIPHKLIDHLQEDLGKWHDEYDALLFLKNQNSRDKKAIHDLKESERDKFNSLMKDCNHFLKKVA